jgi:DNA-dependent RNA polymerase auxiliary subunit epsilon
MKIVSSVVTTPIDQSPHSVRKHMKLWKTTVNLYVDADNKNDAIETVKEELRYLLELENGVLGFETTDQVTFIEESLDHEEGKTG